MTTFIGDISCNIDSKGRVIFPSTFKKQLDNNASEHFVIQKDAHEKCLVVLTLEEFKHRDNVLRKKLNPYNAKHNKLLRKLSLSVIQVSLDGSNRLLIPKDLLEKAEITKEVRMIGENGKIEIWSKDLYENILVDDEDFSDLVDDILGGDNFFNEE